ncbi:MAG: exopolyphosphatase, partial [Rhodocyclaceae bacterium]|nr:exopolyphosphatase [Rhodocyclaceae bacterium]
MSLTTLAAVDLGSNSFHLQIARVVDDVLYPLDSMKETVRLGAGITDNKDIDAPTAERALATLRLFAERLRGMSKDRVRVVGTNALRVAKNAHEFVRQAELILGFPIEVIAGREEARLIYVGVAKTLPPSSHNRMVVDIGGGSTEFIIGHRLKPKLVDSLYMGCVSYSSVYFPNGEIDKRRMKDAQL